MCLASREIFLIIPLLTSKYFSPPLTLKNALSKKKLTEQKNNYNTIIRELLNLMEKRNKRENKIKRKRE